MNEEQIKEQYKVASHWFQSIMLRMHEAIIPLSKLKGDEIVVSWETRIELLQETYNTLISTADPDVELLEKIQFIARVAMGNHRSALVLQGVNPINATELVPIPSFPKLKIERVVFQGFMPG